MNGLSFGCFFLWKNICDFYVRFEDVGYRKNIHSLNIKRIMIIHVYCCCVCVCVCVCTIIVDSFHFFLVPYEFIDQHVGETWMKKTEKKQTKGTTHSIYDITTPIN